MYLERTGFKNLFINGDLRIDQRNAGNAVNYTSSSAVYYTVDRFKTSFFGTGYSGTYATAQQITTDYAPGGSYAMKVSSATGITPSSTLLGGMVSYIVEGFDISGLDWGKSTARALTLSFWLKANKLGNLTVEVENSATIMCYSTTVSITTINTWQKMIVTIPGPTSGTWLLTNGAGIIINLGLYGNIGLGNWLAGPTPSTWSSNRYIFSTNAPQTNFLSTAGDAILFSQFQLEIGTSPTDFEFRPYQIELALCQRYCRRLPTSSGGRVGTGQWNSTTSATLQIPLSPTMRVPVTTASQFVVNALGYTVQEAIAWRANSSITPSYTESSNDQLMVTTITALGTATIGQVANGLGSSVDITINADF